MKKLKYVFFATLAVVVSALPAMAQAVRLQVTTSSRSTRQGDRSRYRIRSRGRFGRYRTGTRRFACCRRRCT